MRPSSGNPAQSRRRQSDVLFGKWSADAAANGEKQPMLTSNFENGAPDWRPVNLAPSVTMDAMTNGPDGNAQAGSGFLRASTTQQGGSVAIDTTYDLAPTRLAVYAWVRAPGPPVSGLLTIWQLSPDGIDNHPDTPFQAVGTWTAIGNVIELIRQPTDTEPVTVRVEFYINTVNASLDIDSVVAVQGL
jgi:hypothetical protein